jgi:hypothetical protein
MAKRPRRDEMKVRTTVVGLSLLCALLFSAFAAPSAFAAKGTTAYTCVPGGGTMKFYTDAHCTAEDNKIGKNGLTEINPGTETPNVIGTNEKTAAETTASTDAVFGSFINGKKVIIKCVKVAYAGALLNEKGPPMKVAGKGITITMTECTASGEFVEKEKCVIKNGEIKTKGKLTSTTPTETMTVEFKPEAEETLFTFELEKCAKPPVGEGLYKIKGTFNAIPEGVELVTTEGSTKGLKLEAEQASLTSRTTLEMEKGNPIITLTSES